MGRVILKSLLGFAFAFLLLESALHLTGFALKRLTSRASDATKEAGAFRILCIGDSNTYGAGVERHEAYPAQLERALTEAHPIRNFEVLNLGVPGSNSSQVLHRLPTYVSHYRPDLLIVLTGVNDFWNVSEREEVLEQTALDRLHALLSWSSLYRLALLVREERRFSAPVAEQEQVKVERIEGGPSLDGPRRPATWEVEGEGVKVSFRNETLGVMLDDRTHTELVERNLRAMVRLAERSATPLVLTQYAANIFHYIPANTAISRVPGVLVVPQDFLEKKSGLDNPNWFADFHPRPPVYEAFARKVSAAISHAGLIH